MWRNLLRYVRLPNLLVFTTVQPVMFVLLFDFVFGGVIKLVVHGPYIDYLMPGIFLQAVVFGSTQTGIGLAEDFSHGMVDRFRSLPMARVAVLTGRTMADTVRNIFVVLLMTGVGALVGFRIERGVLPAILVVIMAVVFGMAFSWISAVIGLITQDVEAAQAAGFIWILPLTFASSAFVPINTMPGWLQAFSKADPVTVVVGAMRGLLLGGPVATHLYESVAWVVGILVVCVPVTLRLYRRLS
ncbi:MAG: ABC transporter permease [Actinomycetota bacterium]|nr:ABC transporter permease [Actinomycetota bacterium]